MGKMMLWFDQKLHMAGQGMGADQPKASPLAKRIARPSPQGPPAPKAKGFRRIVWESNKGKTGIFWAYFVFGYNVRFPGPFFGPKVNRALVAALFVLCRASWSKHGLTSK